jgi:hypothetical protein
MPFSHKPNWTRGKAQVPDATIRSIPTHCPFVVPFHRLTPHVPVRRHDRDGLSHLIGDTGGIST